MFTGLARCLHHEILALEGFAEQMLSTSKDVHGALLLGRLGGSKDGVQSQERPKRVSDSAGVNLGCGTPFKVPNFV